MAKLKPEPHSPGRRKTQGKKSRTNAGAQAEAKTQSPEELLLEASDYLCQLELDKALKTARESMCQYALTYPKESERSCPIFLLLGEIHLAMGDADEARRHYQAAASMDPEGERIGAAAYLWIAQLSEEGGTDSIKWYEKACGILRRELEKLVGGKDDEEAQEEALAISTQLGEALCSMAEIYMTDLSFDEDAGSKCEELITEALLFSPDSPTVLQTLASIRISQLRPDDAKSALERSIELWQHLPDDDPDRPDFATRISLVRLLLELQLEKTAIEVVEQLILEDDESVEAVYLGAWARFLVYETTKENASDSRDWFRKCLRLYRRSDYEDEKLKEHAVETLKKLDEILGGPGDEEEADDSADWEDEDDEGEEDEDGEDEIEVEDENEPEDVDMKDVETSSRTAA